MSDVRRLVIRAPNWLGDAVMALPAIVAARHAFPEAWMALAAPPGVAPIFREQTGGRLDQVITLEQGQEIAGLRGSRADAVLLLPNSFRSALDARRAGIPGRWGFAAGFRSPLLTRAVRRPARGLHQADYYRALAAGLELPVAPEPPSLRVTPATAQRAAALLASLDVAPTAPLIGLAPGAAYGHAKRWPPARVAALIARLVTERGATCVLVGAAGDRDAGREIESLLPAGIRAVNLIGRTDLRVFAGVVARCRGFVTNDSGAMHVAAALGVPVTAIFGPTDERATAPLGDHDVILHQVFCRPCMLRECPIDHRCMKRIAVERVFDSVSRRLEAGA